MEKNITSIKLFNEEGNVVEEITDIEEIVIFMDLGERVQTIGQASPMTLMYASKIIDQQLGGLLGTKEGTEKLMRQLFKGSPDNED